jgi:hypothetical protein|tara:strand:- start:1361 stop:1489 length:129 start_codon:yes stop_codon:yes gene_type:complete
MIDYKHLAYRANRIDRALDRAAIAAAILGGAWIAVILILGIG